MALKPPSRSLRVVRSLIFLVILALVFAIGYSIYRQATSSMETKAMEAGLIESGRIPTIYFNLKNVGSMATNYTYRVTLNHTEVIDNGLIMNLPPGEFFHYTLVLTRSEDYPQIVILEVFSGDQIIGTPIYSHKWLIKG